MRRQILFLGLIGFVFGALPCLAQRKEGDTLTPKSKYRVAVLPVPTFGSAPETGFHFGAVSQFDISPRYDSLARHSIAKIEAEYTTKKQFVTEVAWTLTSPDQHYILDSRNRWMYFPENYWGIGGNAPDSNLVGYQAYRIELSNVLYRAIGKKWYFGISQRFQSVYGLRIPEITPGAAAKFSGLESGISSGAGVALLYDTRTRLLKPGPGEMYFLFHSQGFTKLWGSQYNFATADLDARYYLKITPKSLLAFQVFGQIKGANSPFRMKSLMGGENVMRGFYTGRYRDNHQAVIQTEYRFPIYKWLGMTTFLSAGNVYNTANPALAGDVKASAGLGIRIRVDPKEGTNMRFDFAQGTGGNFGFYVSFGEAF